MHLPASAPVAQQLDIFEDSRRAMLRNDAVVAVERRDLPAARRAWQALSADDPLDDALQPLALLIGVLDAALSTEAFADSPAGRDRLRAAGRGLEGSVQPAAQRCLGDAAAARWLKPLWCALAERAQALSWRADAPRSSPATRSGSANVSADGHANAADVDNFDHAAPLWLLAGDWPEAADAVGRIESWRRIPAPLAWMVEARLRQHGLDDTWPLLTELAWLAPSRLQVLAARIGDRLLTRLLTTFGSTFDGDGATAGDLAWFPAWLLTEQPALAPRLALAQASRRTAPEVAMRLLVELLGFERQGRQADVIAWRRRLRDGHAGLYAAYLRTRRGPSGCGERPAAVVMTCDKSRWPRAHLKGCRKAPSSMRCQRECAESTTMNTALLPNATPTPGPGRPLQLPARLTVARVLTGLLEHLERSRKPVDAGQYRLVAQRLAAELATLPPDPIMDAWMRGHPLAAEVYENGVYAHAGLCRQPLEDALAAELQANAAIAQAARGARSAAP